MITTRRIVQLMLLVTAVTAVGCHPAPPDPLTDYNRKFPAGHSETPALNAIPDYEYYVGSDSAHDFFIVLDGPAKTQHAFQLERNPQAWPDPFPQTSDRSKWILVPGSSAP